MTQTRRLAAVLTATTLVGSLSTGCSGFKQQYCAEQGDIRPAPLGTISDPIWQKHEENAEASDFVIHEHEFVGNSVRLNQAGEEHVKQIAARAAQVPFPILVEPSSMTIRPDTKFKYPIHNDPELDLQRRALIVQALGTMGVTDAEQRVVVSPALTPGFEEFEGERALNRGYGGYGSYGSGFGGFGGAGLGGGFY